MTTPVVEIPSMSTAPSLASAPPMHGGLLGAMRSPLPQHGGTADFGYSTLSESVAALQSAFVAELQVLDYHEHAIGTGAKASAAAYIEMRVGERRLHGVGVDADIVAASFKALLSGMARAQALQAAVAANLLAD